ncbi:hypothetical protein SAMN04490248_10234 [Salinihabitans flavidus]|uniref:Imelysin-like domain-containing protein n=1 Tax=Salinihabitans flavidus TaxID=569882 RepID=A0A1H8MDT1_9RHOB|nr:imelysin family protein [Salinihabitans flavidus]SEO15316.1 hypothetical protein SAMN04490248_10234 [Salinihabitans flavidus]
MRQALAVLSLCLASPAIAGVDAALEEHVLPEMDRFATATEDLAGVAETDCRAEVLRPAYHDAFDAWLGVSHLRFGPMEEGGRALAIAFWPDNRGMVGRTVARLITDEDPVVQSVRDFAEVSVAGRGLYAMERLLYDPTLAAYGHGDYSCALAVAMARDLARLGRGLARDWQAHARSMETAGDQGNVTYIGPREAAQALYTALVSGLKFTADQRLGLPLGTFDRPRPNLAEARRSGRSLRNVILSLQALEGLATALADRPIPETTAAFARALEVARALEDPVFAGVTDPTGRLEVEILQQRIEALVAPVTNEIGVPLGVSTGFNATDGD